MDAKKWIVGAVAAAALVIVPNGAAFAAPPSCGDKGPITDEECDDSYEEVDDRSGGNAGKK